MWRGLVVSGDLRGGTFALIYNTERLRRQRKADPTDPEQILLRREGSTDEKLAHVGEELDAGDRSSSHSSKAPKRAATGGRRRRSLGMPTPANRKRRIDDLSPWATDFDEPSSGGADARFATRAQPSERMMTRTRRQAKTSGHTLTARPIETYAGMQSSE